MRVIYFPALCALAVGLISLASATAYADAQVSSSVQEDFTIEYSLPSGEAQTAQLTKGTNAVGNASVTVKAKATVPITVKNAAGETVATGKVTDNSSYFLMPTGKGFTLHYTGQLAFTGSKNFQGVVIVNALPDRYKLDLFGATGNVGVKNAKIATKFDTKQAVKLAGDDDLFRVTIHEPDGKTTESYSRIYRGRFCVIHKTYDDKVTVSTLGFIPSGKK
jgi:hypothetical protein